MKKFLVFILVSMMALIMACGQVKSPDVKYDSNAWVYGSNKQLAKYPIAGFGYKSSALPPQSWEKWAKVASPVVKEILNKMPDGYVLQVTGHTDSRGPEQPEGNKPGNIKISTDRAKVVYNALRRNGITSKNLTYKGVGSSESMSGADSADASQRRVSFAVVPK